MEPEELDVETNHRFNRIGAAVLKTILILFAVLVVYFLLFPVVVLVSYKLGWLEFTASYPTLEASGAPLDWLSANWEPYSQFLEYLTDLIFP